MGDSCKTHFQAVQTIFLAQRKSTVEPVEIFHQIQTWFCSILVDVLMIVSESSTKKKVRPLSLSNWEQINKMDNGNE